MYMSVAGLERMATGSLARRLSLLRHTSRLIYYEFSKLLQIYINSFLRCVVFTDVDGHLNVNDTYYTLYLCLFNHKNVYSN